MGVVVVSKSWIINYDGLIVNFKDTTEGLLNYPNGHREYFAKIGDNQWLTVDLDMRNPDVVEKINYAHSKAGTNKVNKYFVELLAKEFPRREATITDRQMLNTFKAMTRTLASSIKYKSDKHRYVSDYEAVVVNNQRYTLGQTVNLDGQKYIVKKEANGEGYLDIAEYPPGKGFVVTEGKRYVREVVHHIDYTQGKVFSQTENIGGFFEYINGIHDSKRNGTIITNDKHVERWLKAPKISEIRYWECVDFIPGHRSKADTTGEKISIKEEKIGSRK
jgi:hypothetical protein